MSYLLILFCVGIFVSADICRYKAKYDVNIWVTSTQSYCGGARPTDEMLQDLNTPKPLAEKKLFIRKGKENNIKVPIIKEIITNAAGKIDLKLEAGYYCLVDENKKDRAKINEWLKRYEKSTENYDVINKECIEKWFKTPDLIIEVKEKVNDYTVNFHNACTWHTIPCLPYKGPYPP